MQAPLPSDCWESPAAVAAAVNGYTARYSVDIPGRNLACKNQQDCKVRSWGVGGATGGGGGGMCVVRTGGSALQRHKGERVHVLVPLAKDTHHPAVLMTKCLSIGCHELHGSLAGMHVDAATACPQLFFLIWQLFLKLALNCQHKPLGVCYMQVCGPARKAAEECGSTANRGKCVGFVYDGKCGWLKTSLEGGVAKGGSTVYFSGTPTITSGVLAPARAAPATAKA